MALKDELLAEKSRLQDEIEERVGALQRRIALIDELLATKVESPDEKTTENLNGHAGKLAGRGMRDAIQEVLAEIPGLKPAQVTQLMLRDGYQDNDTRATALGTRVGNEMWRMAKEKILAKDKSGGYKVGGVNKVTLSPVPTYEQPEDNEPERGLSEDERKNGAPAS